ncbi:ketopantoate reductase family protein [Chloroflexota bacterium]
MRAVIYGAGAIGGAVGGYLALAGNDVILIGRPGHVDTINKHGLKFVTPAGTHTLHLPAVADPDQINFGADDVVLLCVKSQDTDETIHALRAVTEDIPVFCLQNGVRNEEIAFRYFPRTYGARVSVGGIFLTNGEVVSDSSPPGFLIIGRYPTGVDSLVEAVATSLRAAGFSVMVTPDVMPYKWGKLMRNLGNAVGAITDATGDDNNRIAEAARQEAREVLAQAGINWTWVVAEEAVPKQPERPAQQRNNKDVEAKMRPRRAQNSTWQSLARQQGTVETEFLNGEIVRLAKKLGLQAPINEALVHITQQMATKRELPGKYTPSELLKLVGLD